MALPLESTGSGHGVPLVGPDENLFSEIDPVLLDPAAATDASHTNAAQTNATAPITTASNVAVPLLATTDERAENALLGALDFDDEPETTGETAPLASNKRKGKREPRQKLTKKQKMEQIQKRFVMSADVQELVDGIQKLGAPFEATVADTIHRSQDIIRPQGDADDVIYELATIEREWKLQNREHSQKVLAILQRRGIVGFGTVELPDSPIEMPSHPQSIDLTSDPVNAAEGT